MKIEHHFCGGLYIKETHFEAGEMGEKHVHNFDHLSTLVSGRVQLEIDDDVSIILDAPKILTIKAGRKHRVIAITDVIWHCSHATDCTDPDTIDQNLTASDG